MNRIEDTTPVAQFQQSVTSEVKASARAQSLGLAEVDVRMMRIAEHASTDLKPSTTQLKTSEVYDYNKIIKLDVYRDASEWGKSILTSGAISNADFQQNSNLSLTRLTNAIKVVESDAFRNAAPSIQRSLAQVFLGGIEDSSISEGLIEAVNSQKFQSFDDDTQKLILSYISRADIIGVHKSALTPLAVQHAVANTKKVFESDGFSNASPEFQRQLLDALFTQANNDFLADNLVEITGTQRFQLLDQRSQKRIINDLSFALLNRGEVAPGSPKNTPALIEIDNIRRLIQSDGFNNSSPDVRARMLNMLGQRKRDVNFTNALIQISGNSERFGRLNESQQLTYLDRTREAVNLGWVRGLSSNQRSRMIEKINGEIENTLRQSQLGRRVVN